MKVAVYTRVSTDHAEQITSMKNQEEYYREYCKNNGYELVNLYADEGLSATSANRKQFLEMLIDAGLDIVKDQETNEIINFKVSKRKPKFDRIITKDITRFARNVDSIGIARRLRKNKVFLYFENMNLNTEKDDWEMEFSLYMTFSQQESIDRSKKVAFAYKQRANKKIFHMGIPLYGFRYDEEKKEYLIDEIEGEIVKEIFDLYVNHDLGTKAIATHLNNKGAKTKKGKHWRGSTIKDMIKNEKYKGQVIFNKYTNSGVTSGRRKVKNDPSKWKVVDDLIPAIIDKDVWEKAQLIMQKRTNEAPDGSKVGSKKIKNIFYNKIYCGDCFVDFTRVSGTKKRKTGIVTEYNYYCKNRRSFGSCDMRGVSHKVIEREVNKLANGQLQDILNLNLIEERNHSNKIIEHLNKKREEAGQAKQQIDEKIQDLSNQIDKLFGNFLSNDVDDFVIKAAQNKIGQLQEEKDKLEKQKLGYEIFELDKIERKVNERLETIQRLTKRKTYEFDEVLKFISKIIVYPDKHLEFIIESPTIILFALGDELENIEDQYAAHSHSVHY
ncbi:recombinase family protein [Bacillus gobiensis]|uniref:recombinase family protein n=1 Tax=Bacillus gobiensis TaxID=1441095 RepID=UPI003D1E97EF